MATLTFFLRPSTRVGNHPGRLCVRVTHQRQSAIQSTPWLLYPEEWNTKEHQLIYPLQAPKRTKYLKQAEAKMESYTQTFADIIYKLEEQGRYRLEDIVNTHRLTTNCDMLSHFTEKLALSLIKNRQERTAKAYRTAVRRLIAFNKGEDIPLKHLNACLFKDFENEMKNESKALNTISFYMRNIRAIYNKAIVEKRIIHTNEQHPFKDVYTGVQKTRKRALDIQDIKQLNDLDFSDVLLTNVTAASAIDQQQAARQGLSQAQRLFLFCFYARGMSFVDLAYLRKESIHGGMIHYFRKKTGGLIEVKITPAMQQIIDSFAHEVMGSIYVFPILKDSKKPLRLQYESALRLQNHRLKKLAALAQLSEAGKTLSTHVARHSWASIAKKENLPLWVISEALGHADEKTTYTYLSSLDRSVLDYASDMITTAVTGHNLCLAYGQMAHRPTLTM